MLSAEWSLEDELAARWEDGVEKGEERGLKKGLKKGRKEGWGDASARIFQLLEEGHSLTEVKQMVASPTM